MSTVLMRAFFSVWKLEGLQGVCGVDHPPCFPTETPSFNVFSGQIDGSSPRMSDIHVELKFGLNKGWEEV